MMKRPKACLIDLSGTLHVESTPTPGAVEAVKRLKDAKIPVRFVTNSTKESTSTLYERVRSMGFDIESEEIFTSLSAAKTLVEQRKLRPLFFLEEDALKDFAHIDTQNPNAVVVGLAPSKFTVDNLNLAMRLLFEHDNLIAIHKGRYYAKNDGLHIGPGAFVTALEYSTSKIATVVGKPNPEFFQLAISSLNVEPEDIVFAGDDIQDDVGGAKNAGMRGYLVRTGKWKPTDDVRTDIIPDGIFDTFADLVNDILK